PFPQGTFLQLVFFLVVLIWTYRKTAPPIVRLCLTIGVQFIRDGLFDVAVSSERQALNGHGCRYFI
ncbi:hypothetical protein, partial [Paenibacillus qinlingensis]|uniref:hypothetical protein n=1 Tax=Paenibacillus qinlingensis TaxID=1837343 RepID=UPI001C206947